MRYIDYLIKCIIRRLVRIIFKPKILIAILLILLIITLMFYNNSYAYEGNDEYTDKNNTLMIAYDTINNDLINRLVNSSSKAFTIINKLKDSTLNYYCYYGDSDGRSMLGGGTVNTSRLYIAFFPSGGNRWHSTQYESYQSIATSIDMLDSVSNLYYFENNDFIEQGANSLYIPRSLIGYKNEALITYINNTSSSDTKAIIEAQEQTTQAVQDLNNTINKADEGEGDTDINNSFTDISSGSSSQDNNSTSLFNFFQSIYDTVNSNITEGDDVLTINIALPYVNKSITLRSDFIYNGIKNTLLYNLIQLSYYTAFGLYIVTSAWRIVLWFQSGQFINGKFVSSENIINDMII